MFIFWDFLFISGDFLVNLSDNLLFIFVNRSEISIFISKPNEGSYHDMAIYEIEDLAINVEPSVVWLKNRW
ncbi:hypothetical protein ACFO4N_15045 [Camelliibacillus cellulosilyticus]|uniref:Uncharacterized protein n=1 Tax=Camelliibacillus cellulosilyticus TaxID=2174486 RepID=A0ABV9GSU7_9BACL